MDKSELDTGICLFCKEKEEFPAEDPIVDLPIHYVCLQLITFNLPRKSSRILMKVLRELNID